MGKYSGNLIYMSSPFVVKQSENTEMTVESFVVSHLKVLDAALNDLL